jgi:hypothetical protein
MEAAPTSTTDVTGTVLTATASWLLRTRLELAALPTAVPCARGHVRSVALEWGLTGLADTAELLASELVTNADAPRGALLYPRCSREELKGGSWA